eukprot:1582229-Pyramimonas_sp.AAC.1
MAPTGWVVQPVVLVAVLVALVAQLVALVTMFVDSRGGTSGGMFSSVLSVQRAFNFRTLSSSTVRS